MDENVKTLQNGIRSSETRGELAKALAKAQGTMQSAELNAQGHFHHKYADFASVVRACRQPLSENGLSVAQFPGRTDSGIMELTTILMHESGEWLEHTLTMPLDKVTPQGYGSAITYAMRYALKAVVGVVTGEDDDGTAATKPPLNGQTKNKPKAPPPVKSIELPMITKAQIKKLNTIGRNHYGNDWDTKRPELAEWISGKRDDGPQVSSSVDLYRAEAAELITELEDKIEAADSG